LLILVPLSKYFGKWCYPSAEGKSQECVDAKLEGHFYISTYTALNELLAVFIYNYCSVDRPGRQPVSDFFSVKHRFKHRYPSAMPLLVMSVTEL